MPAFVLSLSLCFGCQPVLWVATCVLSNFLNLCLSNKFIMKLLMYFAACSYELRYATTRAILEVSFEAAVNVTQEMIKNDLKLNSPKASGESETIIIKSPTVEGSQVSNLNCLFK